MAACEISPRGAEAGPNCPEYVFMIYSYMAVASLLLDGKGSFKDLLGLRLPNMVTV